MLKKPSITSTHSLPPKILPKTPYHSLEPLVLIMLSIKPPTQLGISSSSSHSKNPFVAASRSHALPISCSLGFKKIALEPLRYQFSSDNSLQDAANSTAEEQQPQCPVVGDQETRGREEKGISGIHVPRQRYISVPKAELLDALLSMFESKEDADEFLHLTILIYSKTCSTSALCGHHKEHPVYNLGPT